VILIYSQGKIEPSSGLAAVVEAFCITHQHLRHLGCDYGA
jgi:hypothetical protein